MIEVNKKFKQVNVIKLAEYILKKTGPISHLKLQKLIYFCQAFFLATFDVKLINCDFRAWVHGPVCLELYNKLKDKSILYDEIKYQRKNGELDPEKYLDENLTNDQIEIINEVLKMFSDYSADELESFTHSDLPWKEARMGLSPGEKSNKKLDNELIKNYYKKYISN